MQLTSHNHSTKNLNLQEQNGTLFCNTLAQPLLMFAPRALHDVSIVLAIHFLTLYNVSTSDTVQCKAMYGICPHKSLGQKWPFLALTCCYRSDSIFLLRLCPHKCEILYLDGSCCSSDHVCGFPYYYTLTRLHSPPSSLLELRSTSTYVKTQLATKHHILVEDST
jgi:hypothetical protein